MSEEDAAYAEVLRLEGLLPKLAERLHDAALKLGNATEGERESARARYQTVADELGAVQHKRAVALKLAGRLTELATTRR